jgi:ribosome biogenesis GTPase
MTGKIIKGIAGFYYVHIEGCGVYECKAKGVFRNKSIKPLVGDNVEIDIVDEAEMKGNISTVLERNNDLIRPAVANVDQALVLFALC